MPVTGSEHVHEIPLSVGSAPIITEGPQQGDYDNVYPLEDVHFATLAEKKRLWLRDALINSLFIASWYVKAYSYCNPTLITFISSSYVGSRSQLYFPCTTNGCSLLNISDFHSLSSSRCFTCSSRPCWLPSCGLAGRAGSVPNTIPRGKTLCECIPILSRNDFGGESTGALI